MTSQQHNGQPNGKQQQQQNRPEPVVSQQPGPPQIQRGPLEHVAPGTYPIQGPAVPGQQQPVMAPGYNQGPYRPYPNQGPPIEGQPQPMMPPGNNQVPGPYPAQGPPIAGQPHPMLPPGYMHSQAVRTQPPTFTQGYNQGYFQPVQMQPGETDFASAFGQMLGQSRATGAGQPLSSVNYDREGPSVGVELNPGDDACISVSAEYGEVSKDICCGFTTLICAGPTAGCDMAYNYDISGISVENQCTLSLCGASCIVGCCLLTLGLALDSKISWTDDDAEFELLGTGFDTDKGCALNVFGSKIGFVDEEKKRKYEEKRQRRKNKKEEKRKQKEQAMNQSGDAGGVTNNGATAEDAL